MERTEATAAKRLLVCGDRDWTDSDTILRWIQGQKPTVVIHGAARGADRIAGELAEQLGIPVLKFPAEWTKYGRAAGPIRNRQMLKEGKPDQVLAFHDNIAESKGTADMITAAREAGVFARLVSHTGITVFETRNFFCPLAPDMQDRPPVKPDERYIPGK